MHRFPRSHSPEFKHCPHCGGPLVSHGGDCDFVSPLQSEAPTSSMVVSFISSPRRSASEREDDAAAMKEKDKDSSKSKVKWKKNLYEKQPFADNYVDKTFLDGMSKNTHFLPYDYWAVVHGSSAIIQQVSTVAFFMYIFLCAMRGQFPLHFLVILSFILLACGLCLVLLMDSSLRGVRVDTAFRFSLSALLFGLLLVAATPLLRSLTLAYSSDTIAAWAVILFTSHVFFSDYSYLNGGSEPYAFSFRTPFCT
jgi:hypothetical protein